MVLTGYSTLPRARWLSETFTSCSPCVGAKEFQAQLFLFRSLALFNGNISDTERQELWIRAGFLNLGMTDILGREILWDEKFGGVGNALKGV